MGNLAPNVYNMWADVSVRGHLNGILWPRTHDAACLGLFGPHVSPITLCSWAYGGTSLTRETSRTMKVEPYVGKPEKNLFSPLFHCKCKCLISASASYVC